MAIELYILWEGDAPGLNEHRLSIDAFGDALQVLLAAYRRIASNMIRDADDYAEAGRLRDEAKWLDIEIAEIRGDASTGLTTFCTLRPPQQRVAPLFIGEIAERASKELLDALDHESKGQPRNTNVRDYLSKLPAGVQRQTYTLKESGNEIHAPVVIEAINLAELLSLDLPYLIEFSGSVIAVGFEPGRNEIRIRQEAGQTLTVQASPAQVESALQLRGSLVRGLAVRAKQIRLLRFESKDAPRFEVTRGTVNEQIFRRWEALLRELAQ